jgi:hypothetical protein
MRVMRPFRKSLILRGNRALQISGPLSFVQKLHKIILLFPVLASERPPLTLQKLSFCTPKGKLSHSQRPPFAKPEAKSRISTSIFSISVSRLKIFRSSFLVILFDRTERPAGDVRRVPDPALRKRPVPSAAPALPARPKTIFYTTKRGESFRPWPVHFVCPRQSLSASREAARHLPPSFPAPSAAFRSAFFPSAL